ncbi:hypothetical protein PIB30_007412 [Stylosanthes scabra]|uniref:Uncharacterized protein n=1 Tax=Stylosanthes scabra TaxID=79078 RepID=A0ABU6Q5K2_9FABA|nr:hypothetical protein [Stylosanthes scabra]
MGSDQKPPSSCPLSLVLAHVRQQPPQSAAAPSFLATMNGDNDQKLRQKDLGEHYEAGTELENEQDKALPVPLTSATSRGSGS